MRRLVLLCACSVISAWPQNIPVEPQPTFQERVHYYVQRTYTSRERLAFLVADSALGHLQNDPKEWGRAPECFGARVASNFGRRIVSNTIEFGLGAALDEDTRYRPSQLGPLRQRIWYATTSAFTARVADGKTRFGYSRLGAIAGGVWVASSWHPENKSASDLWQDVGFAVLGKVPDNLLSEFSPDMRRTGARVARAVWRGSRRLTP